MPQNSLLFSYSPATGETVGSVPLTELRDIPMMLDKARSAQERWGAYPLPERLKILATLRTLLLVEEKSIAQLVSLETGKPYPEALAVELVPSLDMIRFLLRDAKSVWGPEHLRLGWFIHKRSTPMA